LLLLDITLSDGTITNEPWYTNHVGANLRVRPNGDWISQTLRHDVVATHSDRFSDVPAYFELRLYDNETDHYDALFAAASEYASKDRYEIGRDVVKMDISANVLQIRSIDFNVPLCANEAVLENGTASIPLFIHTPETGIEYSIALQNKAFI
jgi:hypothetical protein